MGKNSPDLSQSRHRHVEFIFHALRGAMGIGPRSNPPQTHPTYASGEKRMMAHGAMGIRTPDLLNAIEALYQLSYDPERK